MNREETKEVLTLIKDTYSVFNKQPEKIKVSALDNWTALFAEDPQDIVIAAVKAFIVSDTKGFPPVPGQIKEKIKIIMQPKEMTEQEAWQLVHKAIKAGAYMENARAEHEKLPDVIKSIVTAAQLREWALSDVDSVQTVIASNFMRSFRERKRQVSDYMALPVDVRKAVEQFTGTKELEESIC